MGNGSIVFRASHGRAISTVQCDDPSKSSGIGSENAQHGEIKRKLFVRVWVLLTPQHPEQLRPYLFQEHRPCHHRMMTQAQGNHQVVYRYTGYTVMNGDGPLG